MFKSSRSYGWGGVGGVVALMIIVSPPVQTRSQELGVLSFELVWTSSGLSLDNIYNFIILTNLQTVINAGPKTHN